MSPRPWLSALALAAALIGPAPAGAQSKADLKKAEQLFREGAEAEKKGDFDKAIERFKAVLSIKETPQAYLQIGYCDEKLGKMLDAKAAYQTGLELGRKNNDAKVVEVAKEEIDTLEPRIPRVRINVDRAIASPSITLDGSQVAAEKLGTEILVDPGEHRVSASAQGYNARDFTFSAAVAGKALVDVKLDRIAPLPVASTTPTAVATDSARPPSKVPGALIFAGGIALIGGATVPFIIGQKKSSEIDDLCGGSDRQACPLSKKDDIDGQVGVVNRMRALSIGLAVAGVGTTVLGVYFLAKGVPPPQASSVRLEVRDRGVAVAGRF